MREKGGGMVYGEGEMQYRVRIEFTVPKLVSFKHHTWTYHKVFEKCPKNAGKI